MGSPPERDASPEVETLAGATAAVLEGRGVVEMDAPVGGYAPHLPPALRAVTLRQLLSHTAGLDDAEPGEGASSPWDGVSDRTAFGAVVRPLPQQGLAAVALANGGVPPRASADYALSRIVSELRVAAGAPDPPVPATEDGEEGEAGEPPAVPPAELAGSYVNGDRLEVLRARGDSLFYFDGLRELPVRHVGGPVFSAHLDDVREILRFQAARDRDGRLYLFRSGRAFLRTEGVRSAGG